MGLTDEWGNLLAPVLYPSDDQDSRSAVSSPVSNLPPPYLWNPSPHPPPPNDSRVREGLPRFSNLVVLGREVLTLLTPSLSW